MRTRTRWSVVSVALILGLCLGGLATVVSPAQAAKAFNWSRIWKREIKPRADVRYYPRAQANRTFMPRAELLRGTFAASSSDVGSGGGPLLAAVDFIAALPSEPVTHLIPAGAAPPAGCTGDWAHPGAEDGHLCVFIAFDLNVGNAGVARPDGLAGATTTGAVVFANPAEAGASILSGSWAVGTGRATRTPSNPVRPKDDGTRFGLPAN